MMGAYRERRYIHLHHPSCLNGCNTPLLFPTPLVPEKTSKERVTYKIGTNENVEVNSNAATSIVRAIATTTYPTVVE